MRKPLMAGNWKMHKTVEEALQFVEALSGKLPPSDEMDVVICAPFTALAALSAKVAREPLAIGAQNMHHAEQGAYTGEISPVMLKALGIQYVLIGHSERRQYFNETDESVSLKAEAAHRHGLIPIICVGETEEERNLDQTEQVVEKQVQKALARLSAEEAARSIVAYEPVWAIGSGKTPTPEEAGEVIGHIRQVVARQFDDTVAESLRILYGGSVNPDNWLPFKAEKDVDGALVGGASLKPELFLDLVKGGRR